LRARIINQAYHEHREKRDVELESSSGRDSAKRISQADEDECLSIGETASRSRSARERHRLAEARDHGGYSSAIAKFFGTSEQFWLSLQAAYEVSVVKVERRHEIARIKPFQPDQAHAI
jgi:hypothetical protein